MTFHFTTNLYFIYMESPCNIYNEFINTNILADIKYRWQLKPFQSSVCFWPSQQWCGLIALSQKVMAFREWKDGIDERKDRQNREKFFAYRKRKSEVFAWDRNSYLTHVISPQKEIFHVNAVCIGCIGRHVTLSLGWRHSDVTVMSFSKMFYFNVIVCGN